MKTYSSGMGSRLRFAIAASKSHDVLLVDEALATGDAEFRVKSHARIEELRDEAGTVFLVAHNLEEVEQTCNRVIWMERGQMVTQGEDVTGIIDKYIEASGGTPVDPGPGDRVGSGSAAPARQAKASGGSRRSPCHAASPASIRLSLIDSRRPTRGRGSAGSGSMAVTGAASRSRSRISVPGPAGLGRRPRRPGRGPAGGRCRGRGRSRRTGAGRRPRPGRTARRRAPGRRPGSRCPRPSR